MAIDNDNIHRKQLLKTGRWGKKAVGAIIYNPADKTFALGERSSEVLEPGKFGTIGGAIDPRENEKMALERELREELGFNSGVEFKTQKIYTYSEKDFKYSTFVAIAPSNLREMELNLNYENNSLEFKTLEEWKKSDNLHFGMEAIFNDKKAVEILEEWIDFEIENAKKRVTENFKHVARLNKEEAKLKEGDSDIKAFIKSVKSRKFKENNKKKAKINKFQ